MARSRWFMFMNCPVCSRAVEAHPARGEQRKKDPSMIIPFDDKQTLLSEIDAGKWVCQECRSKGLKPAELVRPKVHVVFG